MLKDEQLALERSGNILEFGEGVKKTRTTVERQTATPLLKMDEAAVLLNITTARAYALARMRLLPVVSMGRQKRVSRAALEQFIADGGRKLPTE